jgi:hypothetical protein
MWDRRTQECKFWHIEGSHNEIMFAPIKGPQSTTILILFLERYADIPFLGLMMCYPHSMMIIQYIDEFWWISWCRCKWSQYIPLHYPLVLIIGGKTTCVLADRMWFYVQGWPSLRSPQPSVRLSCIFQEFLAMVAVVIWRYCLAESTTHIKACDGLGFRV